MKVGDYRVGWDHRRIDVENISTKFVSSKIKTESNIESMLEKERNH